MTFLQQFSVVFIFIVLACAFVMMNLVLAWFIRPRVHSQDKYIPYECGERPTGHSWIQFNNRFFIIALVFILFEVEIVFLFPWAVIFKLALTTKMGVSVFTEMCVFIMIMGVALAYIWVKGDLDWIKKS